MGRKGGWQLGVWCLWLWRVPAAEPSCRAARAVASGHARATPAAVGPSDIEQHVSLLINPLRGLRFRSIDSETGPGNLLHGTVEILAESGPTPLPPERERLLPLLRRVVADLGIERIPEPHRYDEAEWVGYRITVFLPVQNLAKKKLLEIDDPISRLEILEKFLEQRKLLG